MISENYMITCYVQYKGSTMDINIMTVPVYRLDEEEYLKQLESRKARS